MRGRRIGTLSLGIGLVGAGILFLVWIFMPSVVNIWFCLKFWPVLLILMGAEVLWGYATAREERLRYDGWGIVLLCFLLIGCFSVASVWSAGQYWIEREMRQGNYSGIPFQIEE